MAKFSKEQIITQLIGIVKEYNKSTNVNEEGVAKVTPAQKIQALKLISELNNYINVKEKGIKNKDDISIDIKLIF